VPQCTAAVLDVLANDTDPDGDALTLTDLSMMAWQLGANIQNNKISWPAGHPVAVTTYTVSDGHGHTATGQFSVDTGSC
jgi:hypothetical protein